MACQPRYLNGFLTSDMIMTQFVNDSCRVNGPCKKLWFIIFKPISYRVVNGWPDNDPTN